MTDENGPKKRKPLWLKALIGLCLLFLLIILTAVITVEYYIYDISTTSFARIQNLSEPDVRFERVIIDDQVVWKGPAIVIDSTKHPRTGRLTPPESIRARFRAARKSVKLTLVIITDRQDRRTLTCTLDNRRGPCTFRVFYHGDRLECKDCVGVVWH